MCLPGRALKSGIELPTPGEHTGSPLQNRRYGVLDCEMFAAISNTWGLTAGLNSKGVNTIVGADPCVCPAEHLNPG